MSEELCRCGQPLHYTSPEMKALVERHIQMLGPDTKVTVGDRTWKVPRHYIALHGLKADEVASLGFEEATD
jgi:hypothetical protein